MAGVRFIELQSRPTEFLDFTSVTLDEFQQLVPPFETAFQCQMAAWRMDGKPRTACGLSHIMADSRQIIWRELLRSLCKYSLRA